MGMVGAAMATLADTRLLFRSLKKSIYDCYLTFLLLLLALYSLSLFLLAAAVCCDLIRAVHSLTVGIDIVGYGVMLIKRCRLVFNDLGVIPPLNNSSFEREPHANFLPSSSPLCLINETEPTIFVPIRFSFCKTEPARSILFFSPKARDYRKGWCCPAAWC